MGVSFALEISLLSISSSSNLICIIKMMNTKEARLCGLSNQDEWEKILTELNLSDLLVKERISWWKKEEQKNNTRERSECVCVTWNESSFQGRDVAGREMKKRDDMLALASASSSSQPILPAN